MAPFDTARAHTLKSEADEFVRRCESALTFARQFGEPEWKVKALIEALADATEASTDWNRVLG